MSNLQIEYVREPDTGEILDYRTFCSVECHKLDAGPKYSGPDSTRYSGPDELVCQYCGNVAHETYHEYRIGSTKTD